MSILEFLFELAVILFFTKLFGVIMKRIGLPQVVGTLIAGIIVGPYVLKLVHPSITLNIIAEIGVILIMFSAGLETNLSDIRKSGKISTLVASMGVLVPMVGGFILSALFNGGFKNMDKLQMIKNIFIGVILTATSVSITVEALKELGKLKTEAGTIILSAAVIDDVIGIAVLSFIIGLKDPTVNPYIAILKIFAFFVLIVIIGIGIHYFFKIFSKKYPHNRRIPIFALSLCLIIAYCGEKFFGVADITGAYLCGIILSGINVKNKNENIGNNINGINVTDYIDKKIDVNAYMVFAPVFFASIGIKATFNGLSLNILAFAICFVLVGILGKIVGCYFASRCMKIKRLESLIIGVGMITRGEVALIVMNKGINAGLINTDFLATGVLLILTSSFLTPILLKLIYKEIDKYNVLHNKLTLIDNHI